MKKICLLLLFISCNSTPTPISSQKLTISGRVQNSNIYHMLIPCTWKIKKPLPNEPLADTRKPICELLLEDEQVLISIHNFPTDSIDDRIPPSAQIARWKNQITSLDESKVSITPQAFGGFSGLLFEGDGVIAWSMQLGQEHYFSLNYPRPDISESDSRQMRADYTIKVIGPNDLIKKHKQTIVKAARSFRLIKEIPKAL